MLDPVEGSTSPPEAIVAESSSSLLASMAADCVRGGGPSPRGTCASRLPRSWTRSKARRVRCAVKGGYTESARRKLRQLRRPLGFNRGKGRSRLGRTCRCGRWQLRRPRKYLLERNGWGDVNAAHAVELDLQLQVGSNLRQSCGRNLARFGKGGYRLKPVDAQPPPRGESSVRLTEVPALPFPTLTASRKALRSTPTASA